MNQVRLHLVDCEKAVVSALREAFRSFPEVQVLHGDILVLAENTIVSPANAAGFMDGGIDKAIRQTLGNTVETRIREIIGSRPEGHLPIGSSIVIRTNHPRIRYLIVAPTMLAPEAIDPVNCYRAMRAILRVAAADDEVGRAVFCPGLGTGVGMVPVELAAGEMAKAYLDWQRQHGLAP